ncbi:hypothetical protein EKO27_g2644 [Xylaria grammica]|uniref:PD-(D/E)XK nuclease-like domain-containing protein n=1 Tax=Xylaria grammica TaxID=363999 RepID=A0A439DDH0_9PEZI|nr:hypothetical protein EKO27_g2644 [Xylaria grammica]
MSMNSAGGSQQPFTDGDRIQSWIHGVELASRRCDDEPLRKRLRRNGNGNVPALSDHNNNAFIHPYNAPPQPRHQHTPPMSDASSGVKRRRADDGMVDLVGDGADGLDDEADEADEADATPRPSTKSTSTKITSTKIPPIPIQFHAAPSPSLSPTELQMLDKPIYVKDLEKDAAQLPEDAKALYSSLLPASSREEIIPHEVRDEVTGLIGAQARPYYFRQAATAGAGATHDALFEVLMDAKEAAANAYHEHGWNNFVHTPLLKTVYASKQRSDWHDAPPQLRVRVVGAMSTPIAGDYIPVALPYAPATPNKGALVSLQQGVPACSVSEPYTDPLFGPGGPKVVQSRSGSKKVDYAVALDLGDTPLMRVLKFYLHNDAVRRCISTPHVNQTFYTALAYSPIACSIETKPAVAASDPLLQLGIWIAAWHKRMHALREYVFSEASFLPRDPSTERMPSTLLIEVAGHSWQLYFACDEGRSISLYGPLTIGSTSTLVDLYMLHTSLTMIREWILTTFYKGMQQWLMSDELVDLVGDR